MYILNRFSTFILILSLEEGMSGSPKIGTDAGGGVAERNAIGVVVRHLEHGACPVDDLADIPLMVTVFLSFCKLLRINDP